eukprot:UN07227
MTHIKNLQFFLSLAGAPIFGADDSNVKQDNWSQKLNPCSQVWKDVLRFLRRSELYLTLRFSHTFLLIFWGSVGRSPPR